MLPLELWEGLRWLQVERELWRHSGGMLSPVLTVWVFAIVVKCVTTLKGVCGFCLVFEALRRAKEVRD